MAVKWDWDTRSNKEAQGNGADSIGTPAMGADGDPDWLATAREAVEASETFISSYLRARWSRSYRAFQSKHSETSKYLTKRYRGRSSLFRPKTRGAVRKADAQVGAAFFSTHDIVQMTAENDADPIQLQGAKLQHELLNLRLDRANTEYGIPWFLTVIGAHQDAKITGICCSKQEWLYEEEITGYEKMEVVDEETGETFEEDQPITRRKVSRPNVRLFPAECVLRDPAADWIDQAQNSSYVILKYPMSAGDVRARMDQDNPIGQNWKPFSEAQIRQAAINQDNSQVRRSRESSGADRMESVFTTVPDFETVWVHENFIRWRGRDMHFWTLGTEHMLTDPIPVSEAYPEQKGRRPIVIGYGQVEAHKVDPQSQVESLGPLQAEANEIVNLRLDNLKQNMSPVAKVKRGAQVDTRQLQNRSADSVILLNKLDDVEWDKPPDVSQSAYAEMNMLNVDMDDIAGVFSAGSVQTNRQLNETVGGLNLLNSSANTMGEFDIRVLNETWMEPVLRQLANLNAYYETDEMILSIAGRRAGVWDQYIAGMEDEADGFLMQNVQLRVDAGMGASDPMQRIQKLQLGAQALALMLGQEVVQGSAQKEALVEEVFGILGYKDGKRFFDPDKQDPRLMAMQQQLQAAAEQIKKLETELADGQADRENDMALQRAKSATALIEGLLQTERDEIRADTQIGQHLLSYGTARRGQDMQDAARREQAERAAKAPRLT